jgi:hypothetical protein
VVAVGTTIADRPNLEFEKVMCGCAVIQDYPAEPMESTVDHLPENNLPADIQRVMNRENAERLWPRLKSL